MIAKKRILIRIFQEKNPKYYPIGRVIRVYDLKTYMGYTDRVCDIQVGDRISKGHFVHAVEVIEN